MNSNSSKNVNLAETKPLSQSSSVVATRYHYMDNLRAVAMLLGVIYHAALTYSPSLYSYWFVPDPAEAFGFDVFQVVSHTFRMPLFFIIAGFFAHYLLQKRGLPSLLKNRALRILVPFLLLWPLNELLMNKLALYAFNDLGIVGPNLNYIVAELEMGMQTGYGLYHLWFLYYLVLFYLFMVLCRALPISLKPLSSLHPLLLILLLPLPGAVSASLSYPTPFSIVPHASAFIYYGAFFLLGFLVFYNMELLDRLQKYWIPLLALSIVGSVTLVCLYLGVIKFDSPEVGSFCYNFVRTYLALYLSLLCLFAGRRFFDIKNSVLRYITDSSYWLYLFHLPVLFIIQFHLSLIGLPVSIKFLISSLGTIALGLVTYALLVRHTPVGWLLNGKKVKISR